MDTKLLADLVCKLEIINSGHADIRGISISGITFDSRKIRKGDLFIPLTGVGRDGHDFIPEAIRQGAAAVIGSKAYDTGDVPYLQVANTRLALALISAAFFDNPSNELTVVGVTGTDGKTTTCNLLYSIMKKSGVKTGMISTVNAVIGDSIVDTGFHVTTPDAPDVQRYLRMMVEAGLTHVILEVTSHGLAQDRVTGCGFDIGIVTNITHEHLDFHKDFDHYRAAKARLFEFLSTTEKKPRGNPRLAVLNKEDDSFAYLDGITRVNKVTYGMHPGCDFYATEILNTKEGIDFQINHQQERWPVSTRLVGQYNIQNCLAAFSACVEGLGISPGTAADGIHQMQGVPGRYEIIDLGQPFEAVVDFAHTPNALSVVLREARLRTQRKLITVFGSAGLRDREKRKLMAEVAVDLADMAIFTAEDPRTESLSEILHEMETAARAKGARNELDYWVIEDRGDAIRKAVALADAGDLVIACGKGHEQSMCFGETEYFWDDRTAMRAALAELLKKNADPMPHLPTSNQD